MIEKHEPSDQFNFRKTGKIETEHYILFRDNRFTKLTINNRHDLKMSKYNNAGYGFQVFEKKSGHNVASIWLLNQVTKKTTYIRVSRYESTAHGHFIATLSEINDLFNAHGYTLMLKTKIEYAQRILEKNFVGTLSKASKSKRGVNDRSTKNVSVEGISFDLSQHTDTYKKYSKYGIIDA